jgi:small multidrug resistance family-3 protein
MCRAGAAGIMGVMVLLRLFLAALLEAGGDALVRAGLRSPGAAKIALMAAGGLTLFAYGWMVNASQWSFGRLLGVYVTLFFLIAQAIGWAAFHEVPGRGTFAGGALIVVGGLMITLWKG